MRRNHQVHVCPALPVRSNSARANSPYTKGLIPPPGKDAQSVQENRLKTLRVRGIGRVSGQAYPWFAFRDCRNTSDFVVCRLFSFALAARISLSHVADNVVSSGRESQIGPAPGGSLAYRSQGNLRNASRRQGRKDFISTHPELARGSVPTLWIGRP